MTTVLFARHGESTWNKQGRVQGWAPTELTDRGEAQSDRLAAALADESPTRLVASDLERAIATAEAVGDAVGLDPAPDRAWRERDFGFLQGLDADEAFERFPRLSLDRGPEMLDERPDGGESLREFADRVERAWTSLRDDLGPTETVVVVTHLGVLQALLAVVDDRSLAETFPADDHDNGAVTELSVRDAGTTLVREASTGHL